jgi:hypothetical protein
MNAKLASIGPAAVVDPPWYEFWDKHPNIIFQRTFGPGAPNLMNSQKKPGVFMLVTRRDDRGRIIGYSVDARQGNLPAAWQGVSLAPRGKNPLGTIGAPLPPYDDDDPECKRKYEEGLSYLCSRLDKEVTDYQRLEGFFPVFDDTTGTLNIDRIRIVNIPCFVEGDIDHSLAVLTLVDGVSGNQNGGGSGPPDP